MGKASEKRMGMVSSLLLRTLAELIREELKDPRLGVLSLTGIRLAKDLTSAVVKVSALGDETQVQECCKVLNSAAPLLWNRLRSETDLRSVPKLRFEPDLSGIYIEEIDRVLRTIEIPPDEPVLDADDDGQAPEAGDSESNDEEARQ